MPSLNIKEVVKLTGLTSKTLRHWEKVSLLFPERGENSYRLYCARDLTRIFYIMSLRDLDLPLAEIAHILENATDDKKALEQHLVRLQEKQTALTELIENLTNKLKKGEYIMTNKDFESFKKEQVAENEVSYGTEIREKYGDAQIDAANQKYMAQSEADVAWAVETHEKIVTMLEKAFETGDESLADEAVLLHKEWLQHFWTQPVTPEAHQAMGAMYVEDERFRKNYDRKHDGVAQLFKDAIVRHYAG